MAGRAEPLFSDADLDEMRQLNDASLPQTATIERPSVAVGAGGTIRRDAYAVVAYDVPCRLSTLSAIEAERAGVRQNDSQWTLVFPAGTDVKMRDRVTVTGITRSGEGTRIESAFAKALHVIGPTAPKAYEVLRKVVASELAPMEHA